MTLANSTWYFDVNEGGPKPFIIKVAFGPQNADGGAVTFGSLTGQWAESNGLFTIELSGGSFGFDTIWTGEYRGRAGSGFGSPEFNNMAFDFAITTTPPADGVLCDIGDLLKGLQKKAA